MAGALAKEEKEEEEEAKGNGNPRLHALALALALALQRFQAACFASEARRLALHSERALSLAEG